MEQEAITTEAWDIMIAFADLTGISATKTPPRRYLWTDAFAVCNFLHLYRQTGEGEYKNLALSLIYQVHNILGRHRKDDPRTGWISGLSEREGQNHPTAGGLRIGKKLNERGPDDPYNERLEWDRDGQYFHYLTKWMHALRRTSAITGDSKYCRWAGELAKAAHAGFAYTLLASGARRMYWKMSIDLSRPLIPSMGLHDPLDGFLAYSELRMCEKERSASSMLPDLDMEIAETAEMCEGGNWQTEDPLGIGGLLFDAGRVFQMTAAGYIKAPGLLAALLRDSRNGLESFVRHNSLNDPAEYRLAFRELGLSIGLRAVARMLNLSGRNSKQFEGGVSHQVEALMQYVALSDIIENFWRSPPNQQTKSWQAHHDINAVMLATSLVPEEFLSI